MIGEARAALYLRKKGMRVLARRYRAGHGEIDLVARDGETLVFVEVKTRIKGRMDEGFRAVNAQKRERLFSAAQAYMAAHGAKQARFDVIEISAAGLRHMKNAF